MSEELSFSRSPMPRVLHFVLNTECNAWDLAPVKGSPGVCRFCYRAKEQVITTKRNIEQLLRMIRSESDIDRIVFTGGDPLMPKENHIEFALQCAKELGFTTNIHTNGLLLQEKYPAIGRCVDVFTLAIDGAYAETVDWERGVGYFERFVANMRLLVNDHKVAAFNTFVSPHNFRELPNVAEMIAELAGQIKIEYWLISQYRPIARDTIKKRGIYIFSPTEFKSAVAEIVRLFPQLNIYSQPTRESDLYPLRIWLLADGTLTADTGRASLNQNVVIGNCLESGFLTLYTQATQLRDKK